MRSVDIDNFRIALGDGIDTLQSSNADVVLMNMQYSPRTEFDDRDRVLRRNHASCRIAA